MFMKSSHISSPKILTCPFCGELIIIDEPGGTRCSECDVNLEIDDRGECTMLVLAWSFFVWNAEKGEVTLQEQTKKKDSEQETLCIKGYKKFGKVIQRRQDYLMHFHFNTRELSPA
jgi:transcription elongation factor Elf1